MLWSDSFWDSVKLDVRKSVAYGNSLILKGADTMTATQRYELIRPIVHQEKTVQQVHIETGVPVSTLYRYIKRFREGGEQIENLADESRAPHSHPKWFTEEQKALVVAYKLENPPISARQISRDLAEKGILEINHHSVADLLKERGLTPEFFSTHLPHSTMRRRLSCFVTLPSLPTP